MDLWESNRGHVSRSIKRFNSFIESTLFWIFLYKMCHALGLILQTIQLSLELTASSFRWRCWKNFQMLKWEDLSGLHRTISPFSYCFVVLLGDPPPFGLSICGCIIIGQGMVSLFWPMSSQGILLFPGNEPSSAFLWNKKCPYLLR